jgi:phosphoserine phosphatase RsbU/P
MIPLTVRDEQRFEQLRKLTEISRALTYATALDQILRLSVAHAAELLDAKGALLMLADEEGLLQVGATHGVASDTLQRFREPLDETLARRLQGLLGVESQECFLGVPLVAHGAVTGLLAIVRSEANPCTEEEEWLLSAVADQVAVALENARLAEEIDQAREERARAVQGAGEADDAKDRALATLSHDLRSPLNAIDSYAELMEMQIFGPVTDRQREALGRIRLSGRHLLAVLENVLEMARIEAGVVRVHQGTVPLPEVIQEAALLVRHSATAKSQTLEIETGPTLVVGADPDRLRQVLINLVGNAIKYTPPGGSIRLRSVARRSGERGWGEVSVIDSGPGIPREKQEAIFEPYYRLASSEADAPEGAGLGLAISRELIRQMGGDIEVESEPGGGSTFTIRLPLQETDAPAGTGD